jgi:diamine N-acetyltransferase
MTVSTQTSCSSRGGEPSFGTGSRAGNQPSAACTGEDGSGVAAVHRPMTTAELTMRALERNDLRFIHDQVNNRSVMTYWFEEPYESFDELEELYNRHIHDNTERRFVVEDSQKQLIGLVELIEIDYIHRRAEFQIIIAPHHQGKGYARFCIHKALDYSFAILNLHKIYLSVAVDNKKALHLYQQCGFIEEGHLINEFFIEGRYRDVKRMYILQKTYLARASQP